VASQSGNAPTATADGTCQPLETPGAMNQLADITSSTGRLIQAGPGSAGGSGGLRTKRSVNTDQIQSSRGVTRAVGGGVVCEHLVRKLPEHCRGGSAGRGPTEESPRLTLAIFNPSSRKAPSESAHRRTEMYSSVARWVSLCQWRTGSNLPLTSSSVSAPSSCNSPGVAR
jgi:hypothetical protein